MKYDIMQKKYGGFVFKKKVLEIVSNDGTRYFVNSEKDVCLYKQVCSKMKKSNMIL